MPLHSDLYSSWVPLTTMHWWLKARVSMIKVPADLVPSKIDFLLLELYISRCLHHTETGESQCLFLYVLGHSSLTKSSKSNTFQKIHIQILSKFCFRPHQMNVKEHGYSSLYTPLIGITTSNLFITKSTVIIDHCLHRT